MVSAMRLTRLGLLPKILLIQAVLLGVAAISVPWAVDILIEARAEFYEHKVLGGRARLIAESLTLDQDGAPHLPPGRYDREGEAGEFGYAVVDTDGTALLSSTAFAARVLAPMSRGTQPLFQPIVSAGRHYAVTSLPVTVGARLLWVVLGWDLDAEDVVFDDVMRDLLPTAIAITVPLVALLLLLNLLVVRRFFRPVLRVAEQVRALDPARMDARLPARGLPSEIMPLATAFNLALGRVEHGAQLQKEFTADAAHELRTPLAVLDARLQTLPASSLRAELLKDTGRMARIVSQLLDLARLEQPVGQTDTADLLAVAQDVVGDLAPAAIANGQELGLTIPDGLATLPVAAREQDVWHMLRNLVENAIRHTPPGTTIEVRLAPPGTVEVRDDGPGIPEALHDQVFRRFWRSQRSDGSGAGLGLAIVQRVAQAGGGSVRLESKPGRGTAFLISLPPAPQR